jgi:YVTN family beta-propeller protein
MRKQTRVRSRITAGVVGIVAGVALATAPAATGATTTTKGFSVTTMEAFNQPKAIAVTPDGKDVYVANSLSNTVSVVATSTNRIVHTISSPHLSAPTGVAISPDGKTAYVSNHGSGTVSKISTATAKVVATIGTNNVNAHPSGMAITPDGKTAFVTEGGLNVVAVINLATSKVTGTISVGIDPEAIAISPDGSKALVTDYGDLTHPGASISVINVATKTVSATITDANKLQSPLGIAISPDGSTAYAANRGQITGPGSSVAVIDLATHTVTSDVTVGGIPTNVAVTPDGTKVYVTTAIDTGVISVIDTATHAVTSVDTSAHPISDMTGVAATPNGDTVYVAGFPGEDFNTGALPELGYGYLLDAIDTGTDTVSDVVPTVGSSPDSIALSPDDTTAYVLGLGAGASSVVSVIDTATDEVTKGIFLSGGEALAVSPDGHWVYATQITASGGEVAVIDTTSDTVTASIPVGNRPDGVAFSPKGARAYVANTSDGTVSVIDTATQTAINTINVQPTSAFSGRPLGVTVSHDGTKVYVSNGAVIHTASGNVTGPLSFDTQQVEGIALSPNDKTAYEVTGGSVVVVANTATGHTSSFQVGPSVGADWMTAVALSPDGTTGYFLANNNNVMLAVNLKTHAITGTVNVGEAPTSLAVSKDGRAVYVANENSNSVSAVALPRPLTKTPIPKIVGTAKVGRTLRVLPGTWGPGAVTLKYHWFAGGKAIAKATHTTLKLTKAQKGKRITVEVTGSRPGYASVTRTSRPTAIVAS